MIIHIFTIMNSFLIELSNNFTICKKISMVFFVFNNSMMNASLIILES
jgi:hypothetical protein